MEIKISLEELNFFNNLINNIISLKKLSKKK